MPTGPHILIATGGSGGHLYPAFAVADEIERRWPDAHVRLTIGSRSIEREICTSAGRPADVLPLVATSEAKRHPVRFARGWWSAKTAVRRLLQQFRPHCVVGTGGFAMCPVVQAALGMKTRVILLEQNVVPGRATRWFSRRAAAVCSSFDRLDPPLKSSHIHHTGNPVRTAIAALVARSHADAGTLLILGGSQGARALNDALAWIAHHQPAVLAERPIVHQTGGQESARELEAAYRSVGLAARVAPFFDDMATLYSQAALLVARAGATTLAEAACTGLPAILVPYPHARDRHQHANAEVFRQRGAAQVVEQEADIASNGERLARAIEEFIRRDEHREVMSQAMRGLARPEAARRVVDIIAGTIGASV